MCQSCSFHIHTRHRCPVIVCGGCAPANQSWHITQTQNATPETKRQPTYSQTHTNTHTEIRKPRAHIHCTLMQNSCSYIAYITLYCCHLNTGTLAVSTKSSYCNGKYAPDSEWKDLCSICSICCMFLFLFCRCLGELILWCKLKFYYILFYWEHNLTTTLIHNKAVLEISTFNLFYTLKYFEVIEMHILSLGALDLILNQLTIGLLEIQSWCCD